MAPRLAARSIIVCGLILGVWITSSPRSGAAAPAASAPRSGAPAKAEGSAPAAVRRPVAVVALSDDPQAEALANLIGTALVNHSTLAPLEPGSMIGALVGEFVDEYRDKIASAEATRARAEKALAEFVFPVAISTAQVGHESLHTVVPSTHAIALYSDLALILAKAKLGESRQAEAAKFFGLVHRLTPGRRLDPALHLPEVVAAYEAARNGHGRTGKLAINGAGRIWIDGNDQGVTTKPFELPEGLHVVWLTGFDRETAGKQVWVEADKENVVELGEAPAPLRLKAQRARIQLRNAPDPGARMVAIRRLADLLSVHDAVLISMPAGKLIVQTWHDKAEGDLQAGFSAHRLAEGEKPSELLRPLAPPAQPALDPSAFRRSEPPPWYRRRGVQATIAAGVLGAIVGSVMIGRALESDHVGLDGDTTFLPPRMSGP
jgi:hypothetical protein